MTSEPCTSCHDHCGCGASTAHVSTHQTLSELDFERGIWSAAFDGDDERVKKHLARGVNPNSRDNAGYMPLHYSARNGHLSVCKLLLAEGADPNCRTRASKSTPLHRAAYCGHSNVVRLLMQSGADPHLCDDDKKSPLHKAAEHNYWTIVELLLAKDNDNHIKDLEDKKGKRAADYASEPNLKALLK